MHRSDVEQRRPQTEWTSRLAGGHPSSARTLFIHRGLRGLALLPQQARDSLAHASREMIDLRYGAWHDPIIVAEVAVVLSGQGRFSGSSIVNRGNSGLYCSSLPDPGVSARPT